MHHRLISYVGRRSRVVMATAVALQTLSALGQQAQPASADNPSGDDVVVLNPFVVTTQGDKGCFAQNTLAGSRMNTNIADLGASPSAGVIRLNVGRETPPYSPVPNVDRALCLTHKDRTCCQRVRTGLTAAEGATCPGTTALAPAGRCARNANPQPV